jgi:predicted metal-dependent hydrolase
MEIHTVILQGQVVPYELHRKNNKRCYLRIKEGKLIVSASFYFSVPEIEDLIMQHQDYILSYIHSYEPRVKYENQGYIYIYGKKYEIVLRDVNKKQCAIHDNCLYVYHHNVKETIEKYTKELLVTYCKEYIRYHQDIVTTMPEITIRNMKSRWGSCFTTRNKITFNSQLIHLEKELIDYVIVHELCHFLQANHSPLFYYEVEKRMPDYKQRKKQLKEIGI